MSTMPPAVSKPPMTVAPEVYEYASKHGIEGALQRLLEATPRVFPTAISLNVFMEADPEIRDYWFIVFELRVPAADLTDPVAADRRWGEEWARAYPYPRMHRFVLSLIPVKE
jgi:hypothetical protein